jgi:hypothetical protein
LAHQQLVHLGLYGYLGDVFADIEQALDEDVEDIGFHST